MITQSQAIGTVRVFFHCPEHTGPENQSSFPAEVYASGIGRRVSARIAHCPSCGGVHDIDITMGAAGKSAGSTRS